MICTKCLENDSPFRGRKPGVLLDGNTTNLNCLENDSPSRGRKLTLKSFAKIVESLRLENDSPSRGRKQRGENEDGYVHQCSSLENDSPSRGRKLRIHHRYETHQRGCKFRK